MLLYEPKLDKTYKITRMRSEDSGQPVRPICAIWSVFAVHMKNVSRLGSWPRTKQCQAKILMSLSHCTSRSARLLCLIGVFAECTCDFVGFVMLRLNLYVSATCSKYSGVFTVYPAHGLINNCNKIIKPSSLKQCEEACITETDFVCRSIDYRPFDSTCQLSSDNKCTAPEKFTSISDWAHYHRNCLDWCTFYSHLSQRLIGELIHVV